MRDQRLLNKFIETLDLSPYQGEVVCKNQDVYSFAGMEKRGGVLYAPHRRQGFLDAMVRIIYGPRADLIGEKYILQRDVRGIRLYSGGYHRVHTGRGTYYSGPHGEPLSREKFMEKIR